MISQKLIPLYKEVYKKMHDEGRVKDVSLGDFEENLAKKLEPVKEEFKRLSNNSINFISDLESKTAEV